MDHRLSAFGRDTLVKRFTVIGGMLVLASIGMSCREPGYRQEVVTGEQGSVVEVKHIPVQYEPAAPQPAAPPYAPPPPAPASVSNSSPTPADPDLATIESRWPNVSPADRKMVSDMVQRLARPGH